MRMIPTSRMDWLRLLLLIVIAIGVAWFCQAQVLAYRLGYSPREGDLIFQSLPHNELVDAIEGVTSSPYSHCGVLLRRDRDWVVIESIGEVRETPLLLWMQRGRKAAFVVYRFKPEYEKILPQFAEQLRSYMGLPYDFDYDISDKAIYCSELPYKAFLKITGQSLGKLERLGDLDWKPYEQFIRSIQGNQLPLDRWMITPASLSRAPQLQEVYRKGM